VTSQPSVAPPWPQKCPKCGIALCDGRCPSCRQGSPIPAPVRTLRPHHFALTVGLFGTLFAANHYALLDVAPILKPALLVFFIPVLSRIAMALLWRRIPNVYRLMSLDSICAVFLVLLGLFVWGNGALDKAEPTLIRTSVVRKTITRSKNNSKGYQLYLASWRPGKIEEMLNVKGNAYRDLPLGKPVMVELHPGRFGMTWYGAITPAPPSED
jgi:hypothetical protein